MKKRTNRVLSIFLAVMMVITAVPFASVLSSIEASAASSATYEEEYYYPAGTQFVTALAIGARKYSWTGSGREDASKEYLTGNGYTLVNKNLNAGCTKSNNKYYFTYMGYKTSADESNAIRAVAFYNGGDSPSSITYTINGHSCTFYPVLNSYVDSSSSSNSVFDLNKGVGGDTIYMYYTKDPNAGPPITSLDYDSSATNNSDSPAQIPCVWLSSSVAGQIADLNRDAGGDYIYMFYGQTGTSVNTSALHNAINSGETYLAKSGNYVSVSALQTAVNNAKTIVNDYNADGLSDEYDQTAINNAATAITNAINALQTNVYLNANGGSIGTSSFAVTVGTKSGATVDLSSYVPTRTGYTFKGWATSSTATSGSTGSVDAGFNTTFYATWEANKYIVNFDDGLYVQTVTFGGTYGTLPIPEKAGHTFLGWYDADGTQLNGSGAVAANDVYVTSKWETNKYTIKWVRVSGRETSDVLEYGAKITAPINTASGFDSEEHYSYSWSPVVSEYVTGDVTYTEIKIAEKHTLGELEVLIQPNCTTDGFKEQRCTVCENIIVNETIPATGHSGDFVTDNEATCTEDGSESRICTECGEKEERVIPETGHNYNKVVTAPTCLYKGFTTYTCENCGDTYVADYVDALGHTEGEVKVENNVDPDCVNNGSYDNVTYCTVCGVETSRETKTVDALGHDYASEVTDPTCVDKGFTTYTCKVCDDTYVDNYVDALGHKEETKTVDATCTTDGSITTTCTVCKEVLKVEVIDALGHTDGEVKVENNVDPDCVNNGSYDNITYCTVCGVETSRETKTVDALGHDYASEVTDPTCVDKGFTTYTCKVCDDTYVDNYVDALGHKEETKTVDATCITDGSITTTCTVCNEVLNVEVIDALGHTDGEVKVENKVDADCVNDGSYDNVTYCTVCGEETSRETIVVDALGHTAGEEVIENNVDPDCENDGSYETVVYCSVCDAELSRVKTTVDALGHDYASEVTDPTCEAQGYTTYVCATCGDTYVDDYVDALGHSEKTTTVDATCTTDGSITTTCTVCGEIISEETITATGHVMGDWTVSKYPTFDEEGLKTKSCANCDCTETEALKPVKLRTTRIISSEINGNTITITGYTNADSIGFYRTTAAGEDIIFDMYYDEEDLANEPTPIKYGDNSPRWIIYNSRWAQYAVDGKYTDKVTIAGVEYNFEVVMNSRELEENDIVLTEKFTNISVDNENKVITLIPPKGTETITLKQTSREYDEFTYTIDADSYDNVTLNEVSGAYRGSYTISADGDFETEVTVTVNKGKYCQEDYTLKVIFIDFDLVNELKPLRGTVSMETDEDGREYLKVTMTDGQASTGIYKTGKGTAVESVSLELNGGTMTEKDNLYVGYVKSNKANPTGEVTITLSNGSVLTYDIVFDMGIVEEENKIDPLSELRLIRATASFDADGTMRITRNSGLATSAGAGLYSTTTAGETITFTTKQGVVYAGRTDAFVAYLSQNTSNVKGVISYTLSDGTVISYNAVIDLGLGDEYVEPEAPEYNVAEDLKVIRGTVSEADGTVTITVASGKTMTGVYVTTASGATVEIKDADGTFADRTDAYVAYIASNSANVEGIMVVTLADGTVYEYNVIFDLGL